MGEMVIDVFDRRSWRQLNGRFRDGVGGNVPLRAAAQAQHRLERLLRQLAGPQRRAPRPRDARVLADAHDAARIAQREGRIS